MTENAKMQRHGEAPPFGLIARIGFFLLAGITDAPD